MQENARLLLQYIYELSQGDTDQIIKRKHLGNALGLSDKETKDALKQLTQAGMIRYILFGSLAMTHIGVSEGRRLVEQATARVSAGTAAGDDMSAWEIDLTRLLQFVVDHYNLEELRTLCFGLAVNYDNVSGETLEGKARELILLLQRSEELDALLSALKQDHPQAFERAGFRIGEYGASQ